VKDVSITPPQTLARPLAARVVDLPEPNQHSNNPSIPEAVITRAIQAMHDGHTHYTDRPGILPLRRLAVDTLGKQYGIEMSPDEVTITCGATEARFVALKQLAKKGTTVVCAGDGQAIKSAGELLGVDVVVAQYIAPENVSVLYLTPNDDRSLLEAAAENGWWIIYDVSEGITGDFHPAQNPAFAPKTITIGSLSHDLPGWRVGWMAGSEMANKLRAFKQSMTICTTSVSQWAALGLHESEG
jgi:aspartate/methionine/tyrosine aminotransferase